MYLVWINPPTNFTFSDDSIFLKKDLGGEHKFSEFACFLRKHWAVYNQILYLSFYTGESKTQRKWFLDEKRDGLVDENRINNQQNEKQ